MSRRPGMVGADDDERPDALEAEMYRRAAMGQQLHALAVVLPMLEQIARDHRPTLRDLLRLVSNNPFVPPGREALYARGLLAGLAGDWPVAAHLLVPQIENSIRWLLVQRGVRDSSLNDQGIQEQRNLSSTLGDAEAEKILGMDLLIDLKGLLIERFGSNVRNRIAHGLMSDRECYSLDVVYLWWLVLHICCLPVAARVLATDEPVGEQADSDGR